MANEKTASKDTAMSKKTDEKRTDVEYYQAQQHDTKCSAWLAMAGLSIISLIAHVSGSNFKDDRGEFDENWSVTWITIALASGVAASALHMFQATADKFSASKAEIVLSIIAALSWILGLPIIVSPDSHLAVSDFNVVDANLYFSSWGAFICSLFVLITVGKEQKVSVAQDVWTKRWFWLVFSSTIAFSSASKMMREAECDEDFGLWPYPHDEYCKDLKVGVSLSVVTTVFSIFMSYFARAAPEKVMVSLCGLIVGVLVLTIECINLAFVTFGNGPGSVVGNLFFSTWISFVLALHLTASHAKAFMAREESSAEEQGDEPAAAPEVSATHNEAEGEKGEKEQEQGEGEDDASAPENKSDLEANRSAPADDMDEADASDENKSSPAGMADPEA